MALFLDSFPSFAWERYKAKLSLASIFVPKCNLGTSKSKEQNKKRLKPIWATARKACGYLNAWIYAIVSYQSEIKLPW
jgi:hypothetical protein